MWFALCDLEAQAPTKWSNTTPHYYPNMRFDWKTKIVEPFFGASLFSVWVRDWHSVVRRVNFIKYGWMTKTTECRSLFQLRSDISGLGRWRLFLKLEIKCNSCPTHSLLWYPAQSFAFVAADTATLEATFVHFAINSCKTNLRCRSEECIKIWKIAPKICLLRKFANCYALKSNKVSVFGADKLHHWSQLTHFQMQKSKCNSLPRVPCYNTSGFKIQINKNTERRKTERQKDRHTEILLISKCKRASATPPGFEQTPKSTASTFRVLSGLQILDWKPCLGSSLIEAQSVQLHLMWKHFAFLTSLQSVLAWTAIRVASSSWNDSLWRIKYRSCLKRKLNVHFKDFFKSLKSPFSAPEESTIESLSRGFLFAFHWKSFSLYIVQPPFVNEIHFPMLSVSMKMMMMVMVTISM